MYMYINMEMHIIILILIGRPLNLVDASEKLAPAAVHFNRPAIDSNPG